MKRKRKSAGYYIASGMADVIGAAAASLSIVIMLLMLGSLFSWVTSDLAMTFSDLTDNISDAVFIIDEHKPSVNE